MKKKLLSLLFCVLQAVVGILLLVNPIAFTSAILIAIGALLVTVGVVGTVQYFKTPIEPASKGQLLTKGLLTILLGLFGIFGSGWVIATFPIITVIYGIILLVVGVSKIQFVADTIRKKQTRWLLGLISAVITLICAVVVIMNPFTSTAILWMFTGISIIVDAVLDVVAILLIQESEVTAEE